MGSDTDVGMVALGGAVAFVLVWLIQWLAPGAPVSPQLSVAFGTIFTIVFTYLLPRRYVPRHREMSARDSRD